MLHAAAEKVRDGRYSARFRHNYISNVLTRDQSGRVRNAPRLRSRAAVEESGLPVYVAKALRLIVQGALGEAPKRSFQGSELGRQIIHVTRGPVLG